MTLEEPRWRVGRKVPLNVYRGDVPVCQCHTKEDAAAIVYACNFVIDARKAEFDRIDRSGRPL